MPDIQNAQDYVEYESAVAEFFAAEGLKHYSTGTADMLALDYDPDTESGDPWFSKSPCDCCGSSLGGDREYLHGFIGDELVQYEICTDCVYYIEYGRLDDQTKERVR